MSTQITPVDNKGRRERRAFCRPSAHRVDSLTPVPRSAVEPDRRKAKIRPTRTKHEAKLKPTQRNKHNQTTPTTQTNTTQTTQVTQSTQAYTTPTTQTTTAQTTHSSNKHKSNEYNINNQKQLKRIKQTQLKHPKRHNQLKGDSVLLTCGTNTDTRS